jgi:small subunit ribosomal protein S17
MPDDEKIENETEDTEPAEEANVEPAEEAAEPVAEAEVETSEEPSAEEEPAEEPAPAEEPEAEPLAAEAEATEQPPELDTDGGEPSEQVEQAAEREPAEGGDAEAPVAEAAPPAEKRKKKRLPRSERRQRTKKTREKAATRKPITRLPKPEHERGRRQERQGTVVSAAADKTIVVRVDVVKLHPTYKKVVRRSTKLHAHDERNEAKAGDIVRIVETRPLSRMKRWRLQEIVEAAK